MYTFSTLLQRLPAVSQSRIISSGYGLWLMWNGSFNNAVGHTLRDHGMIQLVEDPCQSFWVSFTPDVFRALAKLQIWSKLNPVPLFCQVLPVTVQVGYDLTLSASVPKEFGRQQVDAPQDLEVWIHPKFQDAVKQVHGISLGPSSTMQGLSNSGWAGLIADQGLDYESPMNWYGVIRPLGRLGERESIAGWRAFFSELQAVFQRLGLKFLADDAQGFVIFPLENFRQLRFYCSEIASLVRDLKAAQRAYWPCVFAVAEQKGMSFSMDLPSRFGLDWNRLTPDFLHMHYRDGFTLLDLFKVSEINYGGEQETLDSWCSLTLRDADGLAGQESIEMPLPRRWLAGTGKECFYCGFKNHTPAQCPSKSLPAFRDETWNALGQMGLDDMTRGFKALDDAADPARFSQATAVLMASGKGPDAVLARALFAINAPCQPGLLPMVPRIKQREWPPDPEQLQPEEDFFIREAYTAYVAGDLERAKESVRAVSAKTGRTFEGACLEGFISLDSGDDHMAQFYWQEAARIGGSTVQQGYMHFLQARLREVAGEFKEALGLYRQVHVGSSRWAEPTYREGVCLVKMGFTGQALQSFNELVTREPHFFNRLLIDPEIDRGRVHVLSGLGEPWREAKSNAEDVGKRVEALLKELPEWFDEDHAFRRPAQEHLERMARLAGTENYMAYREVARGMSGFFQEMQKQIDEEIKRIKDRVGIYAQRLRDIQYEAGWFPFPKLLRDFNRDFNFCVQRINWIMTQQLRTAANFRAARRNLPELEERLVGLSKRLLSLRIVRDSTLFAMILGKNFIWLEVVGLILALLTLPVLFFYSSKLGNHWVVEGILAQKWAFQKGLVFMVTLFSLGLASLMTVTSFERKKRKLFEADAERRAELKRAAEERAKARAAANAPRPAATPEKDATGKKPDAKAAKKPEKKSDKKPGKK